MNLSEGLTTKEGDTDCWTKSLKTEPESLAWAVATVAAAVVVVRRTCTSSKASSRASIALVAGSCVRAVMRVLGATIICCCCCCGCCVMVNTCGDDEDDVERGEGSACAGRARFSHIAQLTACEKLTQRGTTLKTKQARCGQQIRLISLPSKQNDE